MMKRITILAAVAAVLLTAGISSALDLKIPLPPSPTTVAKHLFEYFPGPEVYVDPVRHLNFYMEAGVWVSAPVLPPRIVIQGLAPVRVELDTPEPYRHHEETRKRYPPGIQKKLDRGGQLPPGHAKEGKGGGPGMGKGKGK